MLAGDNGLLNRAGESKNRTELASLKEEAQMVMLNRVTERKKLENNTKTLKEDLESGISNVTVESINATDESEGLTDVYYVRKNGKYVTVYEDGNIEEGKVEIWDGEKVSCPEFKKENNLWNWYIYTPSQLKFLADFVNNGNKFDGRDDLKKLVEDANYDIGTVTMSKDTKIYLMNNLDMGARQIEGTRITGEEWIPIGTDYNNVNEKLGIFDGNNYYIKGVYVNRTGKFNGIFGSSNTIKNLKVKDSYIKGTNHTAGIVGYSATGKIENCYNDNTIIVGDSNIGGIVGYSSANIENCVNTGIVTGNNQVAGIVGNITKEINVSKCINYSKITASNVNAGGIVGFTHESNNINECTNSGMISGKGTNVGGIIGCTNASNIINKCVNNGSVDGNDWYVGGITGISNSLSKINECINTGNIRGGEKNCIGGISGIAYGNIEKCWNAGTVVAKSCYIGGIVGSITQSFTGKVCNNYNIGKIINESDNARDIGGIAGYIEMGTTGEIRYNYNLGQIEIKGTGVTNVGGIIGCIGSTEGTRSNNYYLEKKSNVTLNTEGEEKDSEYMKGPEFLSRLNEGQNPAVWEFRLGENNGYPVFIKNE